jgi:hypothetical protein
MEEEAEAALKTGRHHPVCIIKLAARRAGEFFSCVLWRVVVVECEGEEASGGEKG